MDKIIMSKKELEQIRILEILSRKDITQKDAAELIGVSERQVRRKLKIFHKEGPGGLAHKNRGKVSKKKWDFKEEAFSINLLKTDWKDFGPTFASEKLAEKFDIKISPETLRQSMIKNGIWRVNERKIRHRKRRIRKAIFGIMIQLDGSKHDWFEGRAPACTLLVFIDDATSKIVWLEFAKSESCEAVMKATLNYFKQYGMPRSFYVDYGSVFSVNLNNPEREKITQFKRAMDELNVKVKFASSPQAKGRVERANQTLQDRLIKEMRIANISGIEEANEFLRNHYLDKHNDKFAVQPAIEIDAHRSIKGLDLESILCIKEERILANDFTITYNKKVLQLETQQKTIIRPKDSITVSVKLDGSILLSIRKTNLYFNEISERIKPIPEEKIIIDKYFKPNRNSQRWVVGKRPIYQSQFSRVG